MPESLSVEVNESSQVGSARRAARKLAVELGFDEGRAEQVAIVVTEASTNLLKHAKSGEILLRAATETDFPNALEMIALDKGPGMTDIDRCLRDGFSTAGSPGQGLGAIMRLSADNDIYSVPMKGTAILARFFAGPNSTLGKRVPLARVGAVHLPKPGQEVCGDSWGMEQSDGRCTVLMADGLGHGFDARVASLEAVRILHDNAAATPKELLELCHRALRSTRGAAVAVAVMDSNRRILTFAGLGNIAAQICSSAKGSQHLVSANGTAGHYAASIREFTYPWPEDAVLIMHSDGLSTHTGLENYPRLASRDASLTAGVLYRDFRRGNDDATVVVVKAA